MYSPSELTAKQHYKCVYYYKDSKHVYHYRSCSLHHPAHKKSTAKYHRKYKKSASYYRNRARYHKRKASYHRNVAKSYERKARGSSRKYKATPHRKPRKPVKKEPKKPTKRTYKEPSKEKAPEKKEEYKPIPPVIPPVAVEEAPLTSFEDPFVNMSAKEIYSAKRSGVKNNVTGNPELYKPSNEVYEDLTGIVEEGKKKIKNKEAAEALAAEKQAKIDAKEDKKLLKKANFYKHTFEFGFYTDGYKRNDSSSDGRVYMGYIGGEYKHFKYFSWVNNLYIGAYKGGLPDPPDGATQKETAPAVWYDTGVRLYIFSQHIYVGVGVGVGAFANTTDPDGGTAWSTKYELEGLSYADAGLNIPFNENFNIHLSFMYRYNFTNGKAVFSPIATGFGIKAGFQVRFGHAKPKVRKPVVDLSQPKENPDDKLLGNEEVSGSGAQDSSTLPGK